jgi:hypothetical protein
MLGIISYYNKKVHERNGFNESAIFDVGVRSEVAVGGKVGRNKH